MTEATAPAGSNVNWFRIVLTSFVILAGLLTLAMIVAMILWLSGAVHFGPGTLPSAPQQGFPQ